MWGGWAERRGFDDPFYYLCHYINWAMDCLKIVKKKKKNSIFPENSAGGLRSYWICIKNEAVTLEPISKLGLHQKLGKYDGSEWMLTDASNASPWCKIARGGKRSIMRGIRSIVCEKHCGLLDRHKTGKMASGAYLVCVPIFAPTLRTIHQQWKFLADKWHWGKPL